MIPGKTTIKLTKGVPNAEGFQYNTRADSTSPLVPVPLTGYTAVAQIKSNKASRIILLSMTTENGKLAVDSQGNITMIFSEADVAPLPPTAWLGLELRTPAPDAVPIPLIEADVLVYGEGVIA